MLGFNVLNNNIKVKKSNISYYFDRLVYFKIIPNATIVNMSLINA